MIVSLIYSLRLINNKNIPHYMNGFYWYNVVGVLSLIPSNLYYFSDFSHAWAHAINNFSVVFHFSFLGSFIIRVMLLKSYFKYIVVTFSLFLVLIIYFLFSNNFTTSIEQLFSISCLGLTILSLFYFHYIFKYSSHANLLKEPAFWIVTGIFISMSFIVPISATIDYLRYRIPEFNFSIISNLLLVGYIIMHIFFIKGFIISKRKIY